MNLNKFETYKLANELAESIWKIVTTWERFERDTIGKQLVRSADSISANLAEGYGRYFYKENKQFCYYSRGSLLETLNWIEKAKQRNLIKIEVAQSLLSDVELIHIKLNAYIKAIGIQNVNKELY